MYVFHISFDNTYFNGTWFALWAFQNARVCLVSVKIVDGHLDFVMVYTLLSVVLDFVKVKFIYHLIINKFITNELRCYCQ